jgi:hypothetical protein
MVIAAKHFQENKNWLNILLVINLARIFFPHAMNIVVYIADLHLSY